MFNKFITKLNWFLNLIKYFYLIKLGNLPYVMSRDETLDLIIKHKLSVSRFGDGEYDLIQGKSLKFQKYDKMLSNKLNEVINSNLDELIICLPDIYSNRNELKKESNIFARETVISSADLFKNKVSKKVFGNAYITRFYMALRPEFRDVFYPCKLKRLWDAQHLLIIEGFQSRLGVGNDLFDNVNSIERILCPSTDAFSKYETILESITINYSHQLILLALGPTATVLAYDLAKLGIRSIDIGHVDIEYEWFLMKAEKKVDIQNKHVNEVSGLISEDNLKDHVYESQIVTRIH